MIDQETKALIKHYYQNPKRNFELKEYDIKQHQGNSICGDDITVFLALEKGKIKDYSFTGNTSMITTAAASFLGDLIIGQKAQDILKRTAKEIEKEGFSVSERRKRALVIALLAIQNGILKYLKKEEEKTFEDLL